jgi:hypothetical protein
MTKTIPPQKNSIWFRSQLIKLAIRGLPWRRRRKYKWCFSYPSLHKATILVPERDPLIMIYTAAECSAAVVTYRHLVKLISSRPQLWLRSSVSLIPGTWKKRVKILILLFQILTSRFCFHVVVIFATCFACMPEHNAASRACEIIIEMQNDWNGVSTSLPTAIHFNEILCVSKRSVREDGTMHLSLRA